MDQESEYTEEQRKFWNEFADLKAHSIYIDELQKMFAIRERRIYSITVFFSLLSAALWLIKPEDHSPYFYIIPATIILFQMIQLIFPYWFRNQQRTWKLDLLRSNLEMMFSEMEESWYDISHEKLDSEQVQKLWLKYKSEISQLIKEHLPADLPNYSKIHKESVREKDIYFSKYYFPKGEPNEQQESNS